MTMTDDQRKALVRAAATLRDLDQSIKEHEAALKKMQAQRLEMATRTLPDLMNQMEIDAAGLPELGINLRLETWVSASLPKESEAPEQHREAVEWLTSNGHGDLFKDIVSVNFGRYEHNKAISVLQAIKDELRTMGMSENLAQLRETIHPMTYAAFVREQLDAGVVLPLELLGVTTGTHVKIKERR